MVSSTTHHILTISNASDVHLYLIIKAKGFLPNFWGVHLFSPNFTLPPNTKLSTHAINKLNTASSPGELERRVDSVVSLECFLSSRSTSVPSGRLAAMAGGGARYEARHHKKGHARETGCHLSSGAAGCGRAIRAAV
jgi:hypothetical protein